MKHSLRMAALLLSLLLLLPSCMDRQPGAGQQPESEETAPSLPMLPNEIIDPTATASPLRQPDQTYENGIIVSDMKRGLSWGNVLASYGEHPTEPPFAIDAVIPDEGVLAGITLTAEIDEILPDRYNTFFPSNGHYRILRLRTVTPLSGGGMCHWFYLAISSFSEHYDAFAALGTPYLILRGMEQVAYEFTPLYNETKEQTEVLEFPLFTLSPYYDCIPLPATAPDPYRLSEEEERIKEIWKNNTTTVLLREGIAAVSEDNRAALEAMSPNCPPQNPIPLGNGVWSEGWSTPGYLRRGLGDLTRILDGYLTTEIRVIDKSGLIKYPGNGMFTGSAIESHPDLNGPMTQVISDMEQGLISPPHIQNPSEHELKSSGIFGFYAPATDGSALAIIRVSWMYRSRSEEYRGDMYDDLYYIVTEDGYEAIESYDLTERLANTTEQIYYGSYDAFGKCRPDSAIADPEI